MYSTVWPVISVTNKSKTKSAPLAKAGCLLSLILDQQQPLLLILQHGKEIGRHQPQLRQNTTPVPKRHCRTDSLMRNDLLDITAAILDALPNATANSSEQIREIMTFSNLQFSDCHACAQDRRPHIASLTISRLCAQDRRPHTASLTISHLHHSASY